MTNIETAELYWLPQQINSQKKEIGERWLTQSRRKRIRKTINLTWRVKLRPKELDMFAFFFSCSITDKSQVPFYNYAGGHCARSFLTSYDRTAFVHGLQSLPTHYYVKNKWIFTDPFGIQLDFLCSCRRQRPNQDEQNQRKIKIP